MSSFVELTKKTFDQAVTPVLETDGGAIEIEGLDVNFQTGDMVVKTILVASCFGCGGQETTLENAFNGLGLALDGVKNGNPTAEVIQRLNYRQITARDAPRGYALERKI